MSPYTIGIVAFLCTFVGALAGTRLGTLLPEHHLSAEARDTVKLGIGLVATITALVLGLITASAKQSFDAVDEAVKHTAADLLVLDRALARYGPETSEIRGELKGALAHRISTLWPRDEGQPADLDPSKASPAVEQIAARIRQLEPKDGDQRWLQSRAQRGIESILDTRWLLVSGVGPSVPVPFLVILLFWLTITFMGFGMLAPPNATVSAALFVCALSVAGAVFLVLEMAGPFEGLIRISSQPLVQALAHLNE